MKLSKKDVLFVSFMLFSLFFGAGNLIFPPFLGQNAGNLTFHALFFFCITAVALPVLGVIVVSKFDGLENLANLVHPKFSMIYTILIYLSIGPGLGIPRAASLPFEMAVAPYMPKEVNHTIALLIFSAVFFLIAAWIALTPNKLVDRIGKLLTPTLLCLIVFVFIVFLFNGTKNVADALPSYKENPFVKGFLEGYLTMDTIAALNFGFVISSTLQTLGITDKKKTVSYTVLTGIIAGAILAFVYFMLSYMGMCSSGVFEIQENGAWTLRCIVHDLFGEFGALVLAAIFTLACLTTCIGLITSISQYFSTLTIKIKYHHWVYIVSLFSFMICNQGLNTLLKLSVPLLDAIYPISIMLIVLGLSHNLLKDNPYIYPFTIFSVGFISIFYALENAGISFKINALFHTLPSYSLGLGWVSVALIAILVSFLLYKIKPSLQ